jgi:3-deoxy-D-manno-octulosonic-acid transferase
LGETKGLLGLLNHIHTSQAILITTSTSTGYHFLKTHLSKNPIASPYIVRLAPPDECHTLNRFIKQYQVSSFINYEMELWPNLLRVCAHQHIPTYWVAARWTHSASTVYKLFPQITDVCIKNFQYIYPSSVQDGERIQKHISKKDHISSSSNVLDGKFLFYRWIHNSIQTERPPSVTSVARLTLAFLSIHYQELRTLEPFLEALKKKFRLLIFPRNTREFSKVHSLLSRYSITVYSPKMLAEDAKGHLWFNTFGDVEKWLPRCTHAFVGGTLVPKGGHNFWEPWFAKCFIWHGPSIFKQSGVIEILAKYNMAEGIASPQEMLKESNTFSDISRQQWESTLTEILSQMKESLVHLERELACNTPSQSFHTTS